VRALLRSIRGVGGNPTFKRKSGTADMNILGEAWTVPILAYGPGDGILDHTDEERIDVGDYLRSIEVLKLATRDILQI
jgi:LysW-gamma-L-lysine carboxypeptidase